jgi:flagellar biosynthesis/type III secretory pathway chaperone
MYAEMHDQLLEMQKLVDQMNIDLDKMLGLTEAMTEALEQDDTDKFTELLDRRQELMDRIDVLNRQVRKIKIAMELDLDQRAPEELVPALDRRQQLLSDIQQKDAVNRENATLRNEQYKAMLREVRNQRVVQTYERESVHDTGSLFIDRKG